MNTTEAFIQAAVHKFTAERGEKFIYVGRRGMKVHTPGYRTLFMPNGHVVKVSVDDSGVATQVEDEEHLHAIARPHPIRLQIVRHR